MNTATEIEIGIGIKHQIWFGMSRTDVLQQWGEPDHIRVVDDYEDDTREEWIYNSKYSTLTFYNNEEGRLAGISSQNKEFTLNGNQIVDCPIQKILSIIIADYGREPEVNDYGGIVSFFFETLWLELKCTYQRVQTVEWRVLFKDTDHYDWPNA